MDIALANEFDTLSALEGLFAWDILSFVGNFFDDNNVLQVIFFRRE